MIVGLGVAVVGRRSLAAIARLDVGCSCDVGKNRHDAATLPGTAGVDPEEAPRSGIDVDEAAPWVETNADESNGSSETRNLVVSRSGDHEIERTAPAVVGPTMRHPERRENADRLRLKMPLESVREVEDARIDGAFFVVALIAQRVRGAGQVLVSEPPIVAQRR